MCMMLSFSHLFLFGIAVAVINVTKLLDQYILICGNQLCDSQDQNIPDIKQYIGVCQHCSCDKSCMFYGNCCPDLFFSLNVQCINTTIVSHFQQDSKSDVEDFFLMKTSCPPDTDISLKKKCEGEKTFSDLLQYLPVTSLWSHFTYVNIFCAECNDETDIKLWDLSTLCEDFVDFNFLSSYEDIFQNAIVKKCKFSSFLDSGYVKGCHNIYGHNNIKVCNVTGSWVSYDKDIEWACANYDNKHGVFKNVFCYLCNPPIESNRVIQNCNVTGKWNDYDVMIKTACESLGKTLTTYPFKNIFCYICNTESEHRADGNYSDAISIIEETVVDEKYFQYDFDINIIKNEFIFDNLKTQPDYDRASMSNVLDQNAVIDMVNVYEQYYAMTGNGHFCKKVSNLVRVDDNCSCENTCHFDYSSYPCCIDVAFKHSTSCIDTEQGSFLVYDGCLNVENGLEMLPYKCYNTNDTGDLLSTIPVEDINTLANFKNIYCGLCRYHGKDIDAFDFNQSSPSIKQFRPWSFKLTCEIYIPFRFHVFLSDLFNTRQLSKCNITLSPDKCSKKCPKRNRKTHNCADNNSAIAFACQNYFAPPKNITFYYKINDSRLEQYSNIFCAMCETASLTSPTINYCNMTGLWNKYDKEIKLNCLNLPAVGYHWPYKNIFCKICNEKYVEYVSYYVIYEKCIGSPDGESFLHFRSLFTLSFYGDQSYSSGKDNCEQHQIYDPIKEKCRNIVCYPGRMLINGTCLPLLPYTSNLGYIISLAVDVNYNTVIENPSSFMSTIKYQILDHIERHIGINSPFLELIILKANQTCFPKEIWLHSTLHISLFIKIFIADMIDRNNVERKLIELQDNEITFYYNCHFENETTYIHSDCLIICKFNYDEESIYLPTSILPDRFGKDCFIFETYEIENSKYFVHSHVSNFLQCPQIELETTEFQVNLHGITIEITTVNVVLGYYDFYLTKTNTARICVDTFQKIMVTVSETTILQIILMICTILSLLSLFFTFITYCLFPRLRTLPGKNNMSLVTAMFFALVFLEFGINKTENQTACIVLGVCIHYFWLCTFGCLNVCSFHMYRTFKKKTVNHIHKGRNETKHFFCNLLYSYGGPVVVIFLNIILTNVLMDNGSYGYGGSICYISGKLSLIFAFIIPVIIICVSNLFFFISTALSIASTPKINVNDSFKHNRVHFWGCVKLFVITGSSWIVQILDAFLPMSAFSVIVSLLTSFQGLYIFLAYVCNKRVFLLYKNGIGRLITRTSKPTSNDSNTHTHVLSDIKQTSKAKDDDRNKEEIYSKDDDITQSQPEEVLKHNYSNPADAADVISCM